LSLYDNNFIPSHDEKFRRLNNYWDIILKERAEVVLLAGDLTGDGSCGHGFHLAFYYLLCLLDLARIQTFFIRGDNDLDKYYNQIITNMKQFSWIEEISNRAVIYNGIKFWGLPFQTTRTKKKLNKILDNHSKEVDILICHSELKRRTHLFDLPVKHIITGHFDNKICCINDVVFLSFSNDSDTINYGMIEWGENPTYYYSFYNTRQKSSLVYKEIKSSLLNGKRNSLIRIDNIPIQISEFEILQLPKSDYEKDKSALALAIKYLRGNNYSSAVNFLRTTKAEENFKTKRYHTLLKQQFTSKHKLSKSMILDYLGNSYRSEL